MAKIEVFDAGGCCSNGVTNPEQKRAALQVSVAISHLSQQGHDVNGYNLLSDTAKFEENQAVKTLLNSDPTCLPITVIDGEMKKTHALPTMEELSQWTGILVEQLEGKQRITLQAKAIKEE